MRPFFPYYGSKWNMVPYYPEPKHDGIVEPFAGSAAYATRHNAPRARLVDSDPVVCSVWKYLIGATEQDIAELPELPNAGDTLLDHPELSAGARALIGFWLNRGSSVPKLTRTAYSARSDRGQLNWGPRAKERIIEQLPGIRHWSVWCGDFVAARVLEGPATYFIDPPYGVKGRHYRHQFSEFVKLGEWAQTLPGQVIVCEGEGAEWLPFERLGEFKTSGGFSEERVWVGGM